MVVGTSCNPELINFLLYIEFEENPSYWFLYIIATLVWLDSPASDNIQVSTLWPSELGKYSKMYPNCLYDFESDSKMVAEFVFLRFKSFCFVSSEFLNVKRADSRDCLKEPKFPWVSHQCSTAPALLHMNTSRISVVRAWNQLFLLSLRVFSALSP